MSKPDNDDAYSEAFRLMCEVFPARADLMIGIAPAYHGWVIREAFIAGVKWQAERERQTLQAIADAEPGNLVAHGYYESECDRCLELITMAREGLEAGS